MSQIGILLGEDASETFTLVDGAALEQFMRSLGK